MAICAEVRKHPALYQITHPNYSNKGIKDAAWQEVIEKLQAEIGPSMTVPECRKLWDALRESTR